jgi:hypothetical protein
VDGTTSKARATDPERLLPRRSGRHFFVTPNDRPVTPSMAGPGRYDWAYGEGRLLPGQGRPCSRVVALFLFRARTAVGTLAGLRGRHGGRLLGRRLYLKNSPQSASAANPIEGILLYPVVGRSIDLRYRLHGHPVRVATVDLNRPWEEIRTRLLGLLSVTTPPRAEAV